MRETPVHNKYNPRWYWPRVSTYWWLRQPSYLKFILREVSSVFVAFFVVITLFEVRALIRGPAAWAEFQDWLKSPVLIVVHVISFLFVMFHSITWFSLVPRVMVLRLGGKRVSDYWIAGPHYVAWLAVSAAVASLIAGG